MGLGTQTGLPLGVVFTSPFCILLPQALQAFYRPKKGLDLLCRQPTSGLWIYSESQTPSSGLGFIVYLEVCCITRSDQGGDLSHCPEGDTETWIQRKLLHLAP